MHAAIHECQTWAAAADEGSAAVEAGGAEGAARGEECKPAGQQRGSEGMLREVQSTWAEP